MRMAAAQSADRGEDARVTCHNVVHLSVIEEGRFATGQSPGPCSFDDMMSLERDRSRQRLALEGTMMDNDTAKIRALNDRARSTFLGCRVMVTSGIRALDDIAGVMQRVPSKAGWMVA